MISFGRCLIIFSLFVSCWAQPGFNYILNGNVRKTFDTSYAPLKDRQRIDDVENKLGLWDRRGWQDLGMKPVFGKRGFTPRRSMMAMRRFADQPNPFGPQPYMDITGGPQSSDFVQKKVVPDLNKILALLRSLRIRIKNRSAQDILLSMHAYKYLNKFGEEGWEGAFEEFGQHIHELLTHVDVDGLYFFQHPNIVDALEALRRTICRYRECNVGECVLTPFNQSPLRPWIPGGPIPDNLGIHLLPGETILATGLPGPADVQEVLKGSYGDLFRSGKLDRLWVDMHNLIDEMIGVINFVESDEKFELAMSIVTQCNCESGFEGPACDACPAEI